MTPQLLNAPADTKGWTPVQVGGVEAWRAPDGVEYVRARLDETPDVVVTFTRLLGIAPLRLIRAADAVSVRTAQRKERRARREAKARGITVARPADDGFDVAAQLALVRQEASHVD